jgi:hypothetical protein
LSRRRSATDRTGGLTAPTNAVFGYGARCPRLGPETARWPVWRGSPPHPAAGIKPPRAGHRTVEPRPDRVRGSIMCLPERSHEIIAGPEWTTLGHRAALEATGSAPPPGARLPVPGSCPRAARPSPST